MFRKLVLGLAMVVGVFLLAGTVAAQEAGPSDDAVNQIAKKLFCPVCENVPLDVCPTQACTQWRATIKEKLGAGWTEQQILDYFVAQYGERVLAQPSTRGLNLLVWLMPPLLVAAGAFVLWRFLRQMARPDQDFVPHPSGLSPGAVLDGDDYVARLEQELERRR